MKQYTTEIAIVASLLAAYGLYTIWQDGKARKQIKDQIAAGKLAANLVPVQFGGTLAQA